MGKTETIRACFAPRLLCDAEAVLKRIGLTPSEAITLFLTQVKLTKGLPFPVRVPNAETRRAIREAQERKNLQTFKSVSDWAKSVRQM